MYPTNQSKQNASGFTTAIYNVTAGVAIQPQFTCDTYCFESIPSGASVQVNVNGDISTPIVGRAYKLENVSKVLSIISDTTGQINVTYGFGIMTLEGTSAVVTGPLEIEGVDYETGAPTPVVVSQAGSAFGEAIASKIFAQDAVSGNYAAIQEVGAGGNVGGSGGATNQASSLLVAQLDDYQTYAAQTSAAPVQFFPEKSMGLVRITLTPSTTPTANTIIDGTDANGDELPLPVYDQEGFHLFGSLASGIPIADFTAGSPSIFYVNGQTFRAIQINLGTLTGAGTWEVSVEASPLTMSGWLKPYQKATVTSPAQSGIFNGQTKSRAYILNSTAASGTLVAGVANQNIYLVAYSAAVTGASGFTGDSVLKDSITGIPLAVLGLTANGNSVANVQRSAPDDYIGACSTGRGLTWTNTATTPNTSITIEYYQF